MWAVVPIKDIGDAKQRLASVLGVEDRRNLFLVMVEDVLATLAKVSTLEGVMIVSRDPEAERLASQYKARLLEESKNRGHTTAVTYAVRVLKQEGVDGMLQIPGDIPLVKAAEIEQVLSAHRPSPSITIVPSHDRMGSNCVLCSPPDVIPLRFGENSFYFHLQSARNHGLFPQVLTFPGIGLDIDTPEDLQLLSQTIVPSRTGKFLEKNGISLTGNYRRISRRTEGSSIFNKTEQQRFQNKV